MMNRRTKAKLLKALITVPAYMTAVLLRDTAAMHIM